MLNQSFTADNLRKIFDYENRRGHYLEGLFFPNVKEITQEIKNCTSDIRILRKNRSSLDKDDYEEQKKQLYNKKHELKDKKDMLLSKELESISDKITSGEYKFKINKVSTKCGHYAYNIEKNDPCGYFAIKQLQSNLRKLYKVKQGNRYNIISQLANILNDKFPKYIFRTDVKSYYESIPTDHIVKKLNSEHLLTSLSKKYIKQILSEYKTISGGDSGIPRGIGISAYISELFLRDLDYEIKMHPEIIYYSRYVDDIVIIVSPGPNSDPSIAISEFREKIKLLDLSLNPEKTSYVDLLTPTNGALEYLGYKFTISSGVASIALSNNRINKYKERVKLSFIDYHAKSRYNEKKARKLLIKRIRFLTGNTRLLNNKKNSFVGSYFSNCHITDLACLDSIDKFLKNELNNIGHESLKKRLERMSFTKGYLERRFHKFSTADLTSITKVWKHVT